MVRLQENDYIKKKESNSTLKAVKRLVRTCINKMLVV